MKKGRSLYNWYVYFALKEVTFSVDPLRDKKIITNKKELSKIFKATQEKGLTCIPTKIFWKDNLDQIKN